MRGFFGRPKNTDNGATFEEFGRALNDFIAYCNNSRKKKSLGWMSPTVSDIIGLCSLGRPEIVRPPNP